MSSASPIPLAQSVRHSGFPRTRSAVDEDDPRHVTHPHFRDLRLHDRSLCPPLLAEVHWPGSLVSSRDQRDLADGGCRPCALLTWARRVAALRRVDPEL